MCGISGVLQLNRASIPNIEHKISVMNRLLAHRGPDDQGVWVTTNRHLALGHRRLSIIDLSQLAHQPMVGPQQQVIVFNGEIYNHVELRQELKHVWQFKTQSDTEVILAAYQHWGVDCVKKLKGMFAFAIWDGEHLFCTRDHFGMKPFYYTVQDQVFYFASETKALLPFMPSLTTSRTAFAEYLTFQYPMGEHTLFQGIEQLEPAHAMLMGPSGLKTWCYWELHYQLDFDHTEHYFQSRLQDLLQESIHLHLRSDVNVGAYVSGGIDSSLIGLLASEEKQHALPLFHGRFLEGSAYDESEYAQSVAQRIDAELHICDMTAADFSAHLENIIYFMDFPVAGPGVFPQYMVSQLAQQHVKVVLGGQGGDELFGGYARYLIAYFEQVLKAAIDGTMDHRQTYVVTAESIIPHLQMLKTYKPMLQQFWSQGLFESLDKRYYRLINRAVDLDGEVQFSAAEMEHCMQQFSRAFNYPKFEKVESYFNAMTHFDLKCLLPGLLHVEDRVSMAHGLEARVPFLYWPLVEFLATIPATIKFSEGRMKYLLTSTFQHKIPLQILQRKDKMGFPVPLDKWMHGPLRDFIGDILSAGAERQGPISYQKILDQYPTLPNFSRKLWGFVCYEIWQQQFHDQAARYRKMAQTSDDLIFS